MLKVKVKLGFYAASYPILTYELSSEINENFMSSLVSASNQQLLNEIEENTFWKYRMCVLLTVSGIVKVYQTSIFFE